MGNINFSKKLGGRIKKARESADITQVELAEYLRKVTDSQAYRHLIRSLI